MSHYFRFLSNEPIKLTIREKGIAVLTCLSAIWLTACITQFYTPANLPILVASMGASAVILFIIPSSPLAQPWPFAGGHLVSGLTGVLIHHYQTNLQIAAALAVGFAVLLMLLLRCLHPPGAATALAPLLSKSQNSVIDFEYLWLPLGINILVMLGLALIINRFILKHNYPLPIPAQPLKNKPTNLANDLIDIDEAEIEEIIAELDTVVDVSSYELRKIMMHLQLAIFEKNIGKLSCGDIMAKEIITVEYGTEVETAWNLMRANQLTALPVLDRAKRVIGILTRQDFLKNINLTSYAKVEKNWLTFIKPSTETKTNKPEYIGHIMSKNVKLLSSDAEIAELLPLMLEEHHHQIPIIDNQGRFCGMVFENQVMKAMFNQLVINHI